MTAERVWSNAQPTLRQVKGVARRRCVGVDERYVPVSVDGVRVGMEFQRFADVDESGVRAELQGVLVLLLPAPENRLHVGAQEVGVAAHQIARHEIGAGTTFERGVQEEGVIL